MSFLSNCIRHFLFQDKRLGKASWLYFTNSSFSKHKNLPLFLFLTGEQLILSLLDPHTGTQYNCHESRRFPWGKRKVKHPKAARRIGEFKAWPVGAREAASGLPQFFEDVVWGSQICSPGRQAGVQVRAERNTGGSFACSKAIPGPEGQGKLRDL